MSSSGWDGLPELFRSVGLRDIGLRIVHLAWMNGKEKWLQSW